MKGKLLDDLSDRFRVHEYLPKKTLYFLLSLIEVTNIVLFVYKTANS